MFNGIIDNFNFLFYIKYIICYKFFISFIVLKINYLFNINFNLGCSIIINGICLTLIYKFLNFLELDLSYETLKICNLFNRYLNLEKSLLLFNNIDGHFLYGHINTLFFLISKYFLNNFSKLFFICDAFFRDYIFYKYSIFLNGISLTLNEIFLLKKFLIICFNLIDFTNNITNIKYLKLFDFLNIEFDLTVFFILNFLYI